MCLAVEVVVLSNDQGRLIDSVYFIFNLCLIIFLALGVYYEYKSMENPAWYSFHLYLFTNIAFLTYVSFNYLNFGTFCYE